VVWGTSDVWLGGLLGPSGDACSSAGGLAVLPKGSAGRATMALPKGCY